MACGLLLNCKNKAVELYKWFPPMCSYRLRVYPWEYSNYLMVDALGNLAAKVFINFTTKASPTNHIRTEM